jgi:hypothetical protein
MVEFGQSARSLVPDRVVNKEDILPIHQLLQFTTGSEACPEPCKVLITGLNHAALPFCRYLGSSWVSPPPIIGGKIYEKSETLDYGLQLLVLALASS